MKVFQIIIVFSLAFVSGLSAQNHDYFTSDTLTLDTLATNSLDLSISLTTVDLPDSIPSYELKAAVVLPFYSKVDNNEGVELTGIERNFRAFALENLIGFVWASERIKRAGYNIEINVVDESPDSTGKIPWGDLDLNEMDVVIGPVSLQATSKNMRYIQKSGVDHVLLSPVPQEMLNRNSKMRSTFPLIEHSVELIAKDLIEKHLDDNILFLMSGGVDAELEAGFLDLFTLDSTGFNSFGIDSLQFDTIQGSSSSVGSLEKKLNLFQRNVIVTFASSRGRSQLSNLQMIVQTNDVHDICVYGHSKILDFGFIDYDFLERTNTTIARSENINWNDSITSDAIVVFRELYLKDPSIYSIRAHDALIDAFSRNYLKHLNKDFVFNWDISSLPAIVTTKINWNSVSEYGGYMNTHWELRHYHENKWYSSESAPELEIFVKPVLNKEGEYVRKP